MKKVIALILFSASILYADTVTIMNPKYDIYSLENNDNNTFRVRENFRDLYANKYAKSQTYEIFNDIYPAGFYYESGTSTTPPSGYHLLFCDGRAVSRTDYADLFAVIGIQHGQGDGSTTFNIPDCRGRFSRTMDTGAGVDPNAATRTAMGTGGNTGDKIGSVQISTMSAHTHDILYAALDIADTGSGTTVNHLSQAGTQVTAIMTSSGGSETRPVNYNVARFIKY